MTDHFLHPFSDPAESEADFINIVSAIGSTLTDDAGKEYIDGLASLWYCQAGHGRREILDAISAQFEKLATYNTFAPFTNDVAARAATAVAEVSPHPNGRVFFGCSGSEAIDTVLKLSRLVQQQRGNPDKQIIVRRTRGYHGTNFGGTSAQGIAPNREGWGDLVPHFVEVPADDLEAAARLFSEQGHNIAAVLTEPVQGAGGVFTPPAGYLEGLRRLCDDNGALLIFDEVISGFGRTGRWFASQTYDVTPDLITFAKGVTSGYMPVSGVIASRAVSDELEGMGALLRTGYTYSGHPACMAAVIANINVLRDESLVERANHIGELMADGLRALQADGLIESFDGVGAVWGAELGRDTVPIRDHMLQNGVIVRPIITRIAMCPPLVVTDEETGRTLDALTEAIIATR
ncbi:MAG: aspartate aminotransferase family protein [Acidimicrobiales bacterium]